MTLAAAGAAPHDRPRRRRPSRPTASCPAPTRSSTLGDLGGWRPKLVATDLDGTLLDSAGEVSPRTRAALDGLLGRRHPRRRRHRPRPAAARQRPRGARRPRHRRPRAGRLRRRPGARRGAAHRRPAPRPGRRGDRADRGGRRRARSSPSRTPPSRPRPARARCACSTASTGPTPSPRTCCRGTRCCRAGAVLKVFLRSSTLGQDELLALRPAGRRPGRGRGHPRRARLHRGAAARASPRPPVWRSRWSATASASATSSSSATCPTTCR